MPDVIWPDGPHLAAVIVGAGWFLLFVMVYGTRPRPQASPRTTATVHVLARSQQAEDELDWAYDSQQAA